MPVRVVRIITGNDWNVRAHLCSVQPTLHRCGVYPLPLMPEGLVILLLLLNLASLGVLVYWGVGLTRVIQTSRTIPTARDGIALAAAGAARGGGRSSVCLIIPAHNEEEAIRPLLESLKAQDYPDFRALLCLDRCTDQTAEVIRQVVGAGADEAAPFGEVLRDPRFRVVEISSCPEGWAGKVNAAWTGAQQPEAKSADCLLFADADTIFDPACISATVALMEHRDLDLLSLLSTLSTSHWFERIVQPAAGLELIRQYPITRANRRPGQRRRAFANGQYMLFRREAYEAVGGHEAVRDELLEDIALARRIAEAGRSAGLFLADGMLLCRMYESWDGFRKGWKRIYTESARCKVKRLRQAALVSSIMGALLPLAAMANLAVSLVLLLGGEEPLAMVGLVLSALGLAAWFAVIASTYRIARLPLAAVPGFIVGAWLVGQILAEAARDLRTGKPVAWGGRTYIRQPR